MARPPRAASNRAVAGKNVPDTQNQQPESTRIKGGEHSGPRATWGGRLRLNINS